MVVLALTGRSYGATKTWLISVGVWLVAGLAWSTLALWPLFFGPKAQSAQWYADHRSEAKAMIAECQNLALNPTVAQDCANAKDSELLPGANDPTPTP